MAGQIGIKTNLIIDSDKLKKQIETLKSTLAKDNAFKINVAQESLNQLKELQTLVKDITTMAGKGIKVKVNYEKIDKANAYSTLGGKGNGAVVDERITQYTSEMAREAKIQDAIVHQSAENQAMYEGMKTTEINGIRTQALLKFQTDEKEKLTTLIKFSDMGVDVVKTAEKKSGAVRVAELRKSLESTKKGYETLAKVAGFKGNPDFLNLTNALRKVETDFEKTGKVSENAFKGVFDRVTELDKKLVKLSSSSNMKLSELKTQGNINKAIADVENLRKKYDSLKGAFPEVDPDGSVERSLQSMEKGIENIKKSSLGTGQVAFTEMTNSIKSASVEITKMSNQAQLAKDKIAGIDKLDKQVERLLTFEQNGQLSSDAIEKFRAQILALNDIKTEESLKLEIRKIGKEMTDAEQAAKKMANAVKGLGNESHGLKKLSDGLTKMGIYFSAWRLTSEIFQEFKRGINIVSELDNQIVQVGMDMNVTAAESKSLLKESQRIAMETGIGIGEIVKVAGVYSNQTETMASVLAKVKPSAILAGVADANATEITDMFQGVVNQYKLATGDIESLSYEISDSIIGVSKNMAQNFDTSVKELSNVLLDAGAVMSELGYTYQETMAMAGGIMEVTRQSGSELGGALRMIGARIGGAKNTGEDIDAEEISNAAKAYKAIGIEIVNSDGSFKDMKDTMRELNKVWGSLTDVERSYIAEMSAGNRRRNTFMVMMDTMGKQTELTTIAMNSQGDTLEANAKYMESTGAKMQNFTNAMDTLWQNTISSDAIKKILEIGTGFVKIADSLGVVNVALMGFGVALALSGKASRLLNPITEIFTGMITNIILAKAGMEGYAFSTIKASFAALKLAAAQMALKAAIGITFGLAISVAIALIGKLITTFKSASERATAFADSIKETKDLIKDAEGVQKSILDTESKIKSSKDSEERKALQIELLELQKEMAKILPTTTSGYTAEGDAIATSNGKIQEQIDLMRILNQDKAKDWLATKKINEYSLQDMQKERDFVLEQQKALKEARESGATTFGERTVRDANGTRQVSVDIAEAEMELRERMNRINLEYADINAMINLSGDERLKKYTLEQMTIESIVDSMGGFNSSADEAAVSTGVVLRTVAELDEAIAGASENMSELQGIVDEIDDKDFKGISGESVQLIIDKYPELLQYVDDEKMLKQEIMELYNKEKQLSADALSIKLSHIQSEGNAHFTMMNKKVENSEDWYRVNVLNNKELIKTFNNLYGLDLKNYNTLTQAKNSLDKNYVRVAMANYNSLFAGIVYGYNQTAAIADNAAIALNAARRKAGVNTGRNIETDYDSGTGFYKTTAAAAYRAQVVTTQGLNAISWSGVNPSSGSGSGSSGSGSDKDKDSVYESDKAYFNKHTALIEEYQRQLELLERKISKTTESIAYYKEIGSDSAMSMALVLQNRLYAEQTEKLNLLNRAQTDMLNNQRGIANSMSSLGINMSTQTAEDLNYWLDKLYPKISSTNQATIDAQNTKRENFEKSWDSYMDYASELVSVESEIISMQGELLSILKEKYEIEFGIIEKRLSNFAKYTEDINRKLALLDDSASYNTRERLVSQSLSSLQTYKAELESTLRTMNNQKNALSTSSAEWNLINEKVLEYEDTLHDTNSEILQTQQTLKALRDEELNNSLGMLDKIAATVRKQYEEAKKAELDALKAAMDAEVNAKRKELQVLQDRLDAMNDTTSDKEAELKALRDEAKMWENDKSVFAKRQLAELEKLIKEKERDMEKERIQSEMDNLENEITSIEESNQEKVDDVEKTYEQMLSDQNVYQQASMILMNSSQEEVLKLLLSYDERYRGMGSILGKAFATGLMEEITKGLDSFDSLSDGLMSSDKIPWLSSLPSGYTYDQSGGINANGLGAYSTGLSNDVMVGEDGIPLDYASMKALYNYKDMQLAIENANVTMNVNFYTNGQLDVDKSIASLGDMLTGSLAGSGSMLNIKR